jgi:hypothetical protein
MTTTIEERLAELEKRERLNTLFIAVLWERATGRRTTIPETILPDFPQFASAIEALRP